MAPERDGPDTEPAPSATDADVRADSDASPAALDDLRDRDSYDLVYRATRDALWDVLGTATLILFYLALVGVGLSVAIGGIGPFVRGTTTVTGLVVGLVGLEVGGAAGVRVYRLVTE